VSKQSLRQRQPADAARSGTWLRQWGTSQSAAP